MQHARCLILRFATGNLLVFRFFANKALNMIASSILRIPSSLRIYHHIRCSVISLISTLKGDLYLFLAVHRKFSNLNLYEGEER